MTEDCLKLTIYYGERDRVEGRFLADALIDVFAAHRLRVSLVMRGVAGFGYKQHLRTDRLLSLSEDLPLVSVAVDASARIEAVLRDLEALRFDGLVTLERARMVTGDLRAVELTDDPELATKLTVYVGRRERVAGARPTHEAVVQLLHERGVAGATVLLGVDGTAHGVRRRAKFFGRNADVPLMAISVGEGDRIAAVLAELDALLERPVITLEQVRVCKRDGLRRADPHPLPDAHPSGPELWLKLMVYASEQSRHGNAPLYAELIRRLREAGAAGATSLRGIWGYHGDHAPHGDGFLQLRRRVPVLIVTVDTPSRMRRWFDIVDELTAETGLVTSEVVPAFRATADRLQRGDLSLAPRWSG